MNYENGLTAELDKGNTWLWKYREAIRKGEIIAGMDMITELNHLIKEWDDPQYRYDTADADIRIDFIENCVKLTKSPFYGKPMILMLWEKAFIEVAYSFKMMSIDTGGWVDRFQEILMLITRKGGKTELIAALELAELFLGQPGSNIICSGTNDAIADLCYQSIDTMRLIIDPKSLDTWRNQKGIRCNFNNNFLSKLSDSSRNKEGRNIDMAGIDEIWALLDDGIYKPIQQSTSTKDNYKIFMFGSQGFVADGFLDKTLEEYYRINRREDDRESAKRKLPWLYTQDSESEVWETNEQGINLAWEKSNPSIGVVKKWSYLRDRVDEARISKSNRMFVLSKDFNFKVSEAATWLLPEQLDYDTGFDIEDFRGFFCIGGVDLAETTDLCSAKALIMCPDDKRKYLLSMYWIPISKLDNSDDKLAGAEYKEWARDGYLRIVDDTEIDVTIVADWFNELYKKYGIWTVKCGYDQKFSKEFLKRLDEHDIEYENIPQNRIVMSTPTKVTEEEIRQELIVYGNNPIDKWCMKNACIQVWDTGHVMLVKEKNMPGKKIDGAVSMIIVNETYRRNRAEYMLYVKKNRR